MSDSETETDAGSEDDQRPSPGASDPGEPGYDGEVNVGDDGGFEGLAEPTEGSDVQEQQQDR
jgi:hypothetical protein